ncbi:hypothetical protein JKP88DRAFT_279123 [Tribonema minus]|uniref:Alpha/beta hydrolase fold-5 domain-containing protein n=1 Tax=Tribonema minus TaxID=303371 RepID=A0A835Z2C6_9STRA|nr:hypothetical protein JKP88DRAFT_279123 [Tribonema minus]
MRTKTGTLFLAIAALAALVVLACVVAVAPTDAGDGDHAQLEGIMTLDAIEHSRLLMIAQPELAAVLDRNSRGLAQLQVEVPAASRPSLRGARSTAASSAAPPDSVDNSDRLNGWTIPLVFATTSPNPESATIGTGGRRGVLVIGDQSTPADAYTKMVTRFQATGKIFGTVAYTPQVALVTYDDTDTSATVLGKAIKAMADYDPLFWAVIGHGAGGAVASVLAMTNYPKVKVLGLQGANLNLFVGTAFKLLNMDFYCVVATSTPHVKMLGLLGSKVDPLVGTALLKKDLYCVVATGTDSQLGMTAADIAATLQSNAGDVVQQPPAVAQADLPTDDALIATLASGFGFMQYPSLMEEGRPYLISSPEVLVEPKSKADGTRWLAFTPQTQKIRASYLFLQGAAVPPEAYAGVAYRLARNGYLVIVLAAPVRDATKLSGDVILGVMNQYQAVGGNDWFIGGHSNGGVAASSWAYHNLNLVPLGPVDQTSTDLRLRGVLLMAGGAGNDFTTGTGKALPFLQMVGTRDGGSARRPNAVAYYVGILLATVPSDSITTVTIKGGAHFDWGYYGYQSFYVLRLGGTHFDWGYYGYQYPYLLGWVSREDQHQQGADAADKWMKGVLAMGQ